MVECFYKVGVWILIIKTLLFLRSDILSIFTSSASIIASTE